ncbi:MAG TPA: alpha/beta fold hydrolase [Acidobacteriaceae bacterium]|nr:alpha/beta fold hydrolase [Acidobacteriaceae bacterium]
MDAFASEGWRCIAPDMHGYGDSSAPAASAAYALREIVEDMIELHDHLGARPAIWVGHDLGSPVCGALAAHHPECCRGVVLASVPYFPEGFALPSLLPLVDREVYPTINIRTGSGTTTASTSPTSIRRSPTSTRTSRRLSR